MGPHDRRARVAIACQGGGSHTAFTDGVLKRLFDSDDIARYDVVGLSGTSGVACARSSPGRPWPRGYRNAWGPG